MRSSPGQFHGSPEWLPNADPRSDEEGAIHTRSVKAPRDVVHEERVVAVQAGEHLFAHAVQRLPELSASRKDHGAV